LPSADLININRDRRRPWHRGVAGETKVQAMKAGWRVFLLFSAVFAVAFGAERIFVPHIVPIAFAEEPQPLWSVATAFVLRAIELMSASVAVASLVLAAGAWAQRLTRRRAQ
jgi:hypothetical protein